MKNAARILCLLMALLLLGAALAEDGFQALPFPDEGVTLYLPEGYLPVVRDMTEMDPLLAAQGFTPEAADALLDQGHYLMIAFDMENHLVIDAVCTREDNIENLSDLNDAQITQIANGMTSSFSDMGVTVKSFDIVRAGGNAWLRVWYDTPETGAQTFWCVTVRGHKKLSMEVFTAGTPLDTAAQDAFFEGAARTVFE